MRTFLPQRQCALHADVDAPSGRGFIALLQAFRASGGTAPGHIGGRLLGAHQVGSAVSLAKRIATAQAFGFARRNKLWTPMFLFNVNDLALQPRVQSVLAALPLMRPGWMLASWFAGPNARLDGRSPAGMLNADPDAVLRAARSLASVEAFSLPLRPPTQAAAAQL